MQCSICFFVAYVRDLFHLHRGLSKQKSKPRMCDVHWFKFVAVVVTGGSGGRAGGHDLVPTNAKTKPTPLVGVKECATLPGLGQVRI